MARTLSSSKIGAELYSDPDNIYVNETVPQNTNITSDTILLGRTLHGLELVVEAGSTAIGLASTEILTISIAIEETDSFTSSTFETLYTRTFGTSETIAVGTELVRYVVPTDKGSYARLRIATDDTAATGTITARIASVKKA